MKNFRNLSKKSLSIVMMMWAIIMLTIVGKVQAQLPLNLSVVSADSLVCYGQNSGTITIYVVGGTPPYTYLWNTSATGMTINSLTAGTYTVTVTDNVGVNAIKSTTIHEDSLLVVIVTHNDTLPCNAVNTGSVTIAVNGGTPPYTYQWNTTPTQDSLVAINLAAGTYTVTVTDNWGCTKTINAIVFQPTPPTRQICYAGFDTITLKNNVYFPTDLTANIDSFHVYKEVSLNVWDLIGSVKAGGSNYFTDINCDPSAQSYSYEIAVLDTCGHEGTKSNVHTTITLIGNYIPSTNTYGFTWSAYVGLTVSNYYIYGLTASGTATQIGTVLGNQYYFNYVNPNPAYIEYFVGFAAPDCNTTARTSSLNLVKSNYVQSTSGITEIGGINNLVSFYPNPVKDNLQLQTTLQIKNIEITDITGRLLCTTISKTIDCSSLASGVYFIKVKTEKGVAVKKFIKE